MGKIKQSTNQVWVYMDDGMKEKLHRMASQDRVTMSEFVRRLVNREIERRCVLFLSGVTLNVMACEETNGVQPK